MKLFISFSMFAICFSYIGIPLHPGKRGDCGKILDKLIAKATKNFGSQFDPCSLPDYEFRFIWRLASEAYPGQINLYNGTMHGLLPLQRDGNCIMEFPGENVKMTANLTMELMRYEYASSITFQIHTPPLDMVYGRVRQISLELNLETNNDTMIIKELAISEMQEIEILIQEISIIRSKIKLMSKALLKFFKTRIKEALETHLREFIDNEIKSINIIKFIIESLKS